MERREIVVIGASAGGVEALRQLVQALPADFGAAVFVVLHLPSYADSALPEILQRGCPLTVSHAVHEAAVEPGRVYVARPDHHLLLEPGRMLLSRGPRENGHRPAADPLFRSAAVAYGRQVIGVVLSGNLDDGTAGLAAIRRRGGCSVVQDPSDALHPGMPSSALANVRIDHCLPLSRMPAVLARLVSEPLPQPAPDAALDQAEFETDIAEMEPYAMHADVRPGVPSGFSCPECNGTLWEIHEGELVRYRCRVGHAFGSETLLAEQSAAVETALWTAFQTLKERASFARGLARKMETRGNYFSRERFMEQAAQAEARAAVIREVLREPEPGEGALAASVAHTGADPGSDP